MRLHNTAEGESTDSSCSSGMTSTDPAEDRYIPPQKAEAEEAKILNLRLHNTAESESTDSSRSSDMTSTDPAEDRYILPRRPSAVRSMILYTTKASWLERECLLLLMKNFKLPPT